MTYPTNNSCSIVLIVRSSLMYICVTSDPSMKSKSSTEGATDGR